MTYYTRILSFSNENELKDLLINFRNYYPSEATESYLTKLQYIINQNEFNSNGYYIGFNVGNKNLFLPNIDMKDILKSNNSDEIQVIDLHDFVNIIKNSHGIIPKAPPIYEAATPKNKEVMEELLISVDYRDRNNAYWQESVFRNKTIIVGSEECFHSVLTKALKDEDFMTLTYKGKPRQNIYIDTKNGPKITGYMYCGKTEIDDKRVFFDVWVTVKKLTDYQFEIIED